MRFFRGCKTAALFVGSVVGAGFATGQEILLFFGEGGTADLLIAALFMAFSAYLFLNLSDAPVLNDARIKVGADAVIALSSFAVYAAMIAASEEVLRSLTGRAGWSAALAIAVSCVAGKKNRGIAALNLIAVPLMIAVIAFVGVRFGGRTEGSLHPLRAIGYGGMNLLFSAALMREEGRKLTRGERRIASLLIGAMLFPMLLFMRRTVALSPSPNMPFLAVASRAGLGTISSLSLLLAIVTTMASCGYLATDRLTVFTKDPLLSISSVTLLGILAATIGFAPLVLATYPIVSYLGIAVTLGGLGVSFFFFLEKRKGAKVRLKKSGT